MLYFGSWIYQGPIALCAPSYILLDPTGLLHKLRRTINNISPCQQVNSCHPFFTLPAPIYEATCSHSEHAEALDQHPTGAPFKAPLQGLFPLATFHSRAADEGHQALQVPNLVTSAQPSHHASHQVTAPDRRRHLICSSIQRYTAVQAWRSKANLGRMRSDASD